MNYRVNKEVIGEDYDDDVHAVLSGDFFTLRSMTQAENIFKYVLANRHEDLSKFASKLCNARHEPGLLEFIVRDFQRSLLTWSYQRWRKWHNNDLPCDNFWLPYRGHVSVVYTRLETLARDYVDRLCILVSVDVVSKSCD